MTECPAHAGVEAVGTCARCGRFYCAAEKLELEGKTYCAECGTREDLDWLGKHYRRLEGTRSGLAWFLLALGMTVAAGSLAGLIGSENWKERGFFAGLLVMGLAAMTVMSGKTWSRLVLLGSAPVAAVFFVAGTAEPWSAALVLPTLMVSAATWTDVRTKLFFRIPVDRDALRKHFDREGSNPLAVSASRLALLSLFIPGLGVLSLIMGVMALTRIDAKAVPPVGNVSAALGAIGFSVFSSLIWFGSMFA